MPVFIVHQEETIEGLSGIPDLPHKQFKYPCLEENLVVEPSVHAFV